MREIKVLFLAGDYWHPVEIVRRGLSSFRDLLSGIQTDVVEDAKDILTPEMLRQYDVCVCAKANEITAANRNPWFEAGVTEVTPQTFRSWISEGHGFLSLHAGNSFFAEDKGDPVFDGPNRDYIELVGNSFKNHPPRCPVTYTPLREHPVLRGVSAFTVRDEHYQLENLSDDRDVFLVSTSDTGLKQPAGYERVIGKGRLVVLTPGHTLAVWQNTDFQLMLSNALRYLAGFR